MLHSDMILGERKKAENYEVTNSRWFAKRSSLTAGVWGPQKLWGK